MKPTFLVHYLDKGYAPAKVEFAEITGDIAVWNYGDGRFGYYDEPGQKTIVHTYLKNGTYVVFARSKSGEYSDGISVVIKDPNAPEPKPPAPTPTKSLWQGFIDWLKSLFRMA